MTFDKCGNFFAAVFFLAAAFLCASHSAQAQSVTRLTFFEGHDITPAWDPRGVNIAYLRAKAVGQNFFDAYKVESSGQADEQPLLTGLSTDFGVATTTSWIGTSGFLAVEEAISGFEVLKFNTALAPFNRTVTNGSDAGTTVLLSIDGGGGGGLTKISRNGLVALERFSSSGSSGSISIRTGAVSTMTGQASSTFGTALISTTSNTDLFSNGGALNADGSRFVIASPAGSGYDLVLGSTSNAFPSVNLTNDGSSGVRNVFPDISADGKKVVFARSTPSSNGMFDLYTINIDGSDLTQITDTPNFSENRPSWSPGGESLAFDGMHLAGNESDFPALVPGEAANFNVYLMLLPPANVVTPKTKLKDPPLVTINDRNVTFILAPFAKAQLGAGGGALAGISAAKAKVTFKYDLEIAKTEKPRTLIREIAKKNIITVRNLKTGTYTARYRIQLISKTGSNPPVVKNTGYSPRARFEVGE